MEAFSKSKADTNDGKPQSVHKARIVCAMHKINWAYITQKHGKVREKNIMYINKIIHSKQPQNFSHNFWVGFIIIMVWPNIARANSIKNVALIENIDLAYWWNFQQKHTLRAYNTSAHRLIWSLHKLSKLHTRCFIIACQSLYLRFPDLYGHFYEFGF